MSSWSRLIQHPEGIRAVFSMIKSEKAAAVGLNAENYLKLGSAVRACVYKEDDGLVSTYTLTDTDLYMVQELFW